MKKMLAVRILGIIICLFTGSQALADNPINFESSDASIIIDGYPDDWGDIQPVVTDPQSDSLSHIPETDIKALYLARDNTYLYIRFDVYQTPIDSAFCSGATGGYGLHFTHSDISGDADYYGAIRAVVKDQEVYPYVENGDHTLENGVEEYDVQCSIGPETIEIKCKLTFFTDQDLPIDKIGIFKTGSVCDSPGWTPTDEVSYSGPIPIQNINERSNETCGAYVAPNVWKEFDCYNLAAIGKTTDDDPFTPSWRLIGGYWQWGRKGPDESQWYDTNTEHFAHGPTSPDAGDANSGEISGWNQTDSPDEAWSAKSMVVYYLLDQDADLFNTDIDRDGVVDLLANINTNGLRFSVDGGEVQVIEFDKSLLINKDVINHEDYVAALQYPLENLIAQGKVPADITLKLYHTLTNFTYLDDGSRSSDIPAMVIETGTGSILNSTGFKWVEDLVGNFNVYGKVVDGTGIEDPCPTGYRVPTKDEWDDVLANNEKEYVGDSWSSSATNYDTGLKLGDSLFLPAAGYRDYKSSGSLSGRGNDGYYWSSSESTGSYVARGLHFTSGDADTGSNSRPFGFSIRCIADSEAPLTCTYSISPTSGNFPASGGTDIVTVTSSDPDCTWTTSNSLSWVTVSPTSGTGSGNITISVNSNSGAARSGSITIAGQTYTISQAEGAAGEKCGAYVAPGVWKEFDCYNLAAIGKTTNDDPFTPSWRLIGGYWQWGRKGPDESQWYDTNTEHFAHGPTGPNAEDANASPVGENVEVTVNAVTASSGALDASGANYTFIISGDASYTQEITGFDVGDVLVFPEENLPTLNNANFSDGIVEIQYAFAPFVSIVRLTGLDASIDQQLLGMASFDRVFGDTGATVEWDSSYAPDGAWSDLSKTANDPCPDSFRIPTISQWDGVVDNNTQSTVGTWDSEDTNYSSALFLGNDLMLPAAGYRDHSNGVLDRRGGRSIYQSSSNYSSNSAWHLYFRDNSVETRSDRVRRWGFSVRCISDSEAPLPCTYSISPTSGNFPASGGTDIVTVTSSDPDCTWTASESLSWVSLSSTGGEGSQSTLTITIDPNTGDARSGSITIAGQTHTITQAGIADQTAVVLTRTSPDHTITSGSDVQVYGTASTNQVILESGAKAELINFPGFNSIQLQSSADGFTVSRSGIVVTFEGTDGTRLKMPATTSVQTIAFSDREPLTLSIHDNQVMLDDQVVTTTPVTISPGEPVEEHTLEVIIEGGQNNNFNEFPGEDLGMKVSAWSTVETPQFTYQILSSDLDFSLIDNEGNVTASVPESAAPGSTLSLQFRVSEAVSQLTQEVTASVYVMQKTVVGSGVVSEQGGTVSDDTNSFSVEVPPGVADQQDIQIEIYKGETEDGRQVISFWSDSQKTDTVKIHLPDLSKGESSIFTSSRQSDPSMQSQIVEGYLNWEIDTYDKGGHYPWTWYIKYKGGITSPLNFYYRVPGERIFSDIISGEPEQDIYIPLDELYEKLNCEPRKTLRLMSTYSFESSLLKNDYVPVLFIHGYQTLGEFGGGHDYWGNFPFLMDQLEINGWKIKAFDFHWRSDSRFQDAAHDLAKTIKILYALTGNKKIHIVAHSFGGVLARCFLQGLYLDSDQDNPTDYVASLISFGSPYSGIFDEDTPVNHIMFPDGRHNPITDAARNMTVYQMGEDVNYGRIKPYLILNDSPGEIAFQLADTIDLIPSDFPMTIGISTIALTQTMTHWVFYPDIYFSEGDGLISFKGQRFYPMLRTDPLLSVTTGNNMIFGHTLNVNEIFMGYNNDTVPDMESKTEIWDVTDLTENEISNGSALEDLVTNTLNYKHSKSFTMAWGTYANNVQTYVTCNSIDDCTHEAFVHTKDHLSQNISQFAEEPLTVVITSPESDITITKGETVDFSAHISGGRPEYDRYEIEWNFGDGGYDATGADVSHIFDEVGTFDVTITVSDYDNTTETDTVRVTVREGGEPTGCGAFIAEGVWKEFDCYNLAAIGKTTNDDPFTPSWRLIGGYWQWGRKGPGDPDWYHTNTEYFAHGPTGPGASDTNNFQGISEWGKTEASDGAWSDSDKDPCPLGYRVPTIDEWNNVLANNEKEYVGSWAPGTNYDTGLKLGEALFLPAAGLRTSNYFIGGLEYYGSRGYYWSSSEADSTHSNDYAWHLYFSNGTSTTNNKPRHNGQPVRCISE